MHQAMPWYIALVRWMTGRDVDTILQCYKSGANVGQTVTCMVSEKDSSVFGPEFHQHYPTHSCFYECVCQYPGSKEKYGAEQRKNWAEASTR